MGGDPFAEDDPPGRLYGEARVCTNGAFFARVQYETGETVGGLRGPSGTVLVVLANG